MERIEPVGTCSECQGPVVVSRIQREPVRVCAKCGAEAALPFGPEVTMRVPR